MKTATEGTHQVFEVHGVVLQAEAWGSGETVAFLHGFDSSEGDAMIRRLAERFQILAFEHPGFGEAPRPEWAETIEDFAFIYAGWLDGVKEPVHLVGSSFGGWLAVEVAIRYRTGLRSLTLIDPLGLYLPDSPPDDLFTKEAGEFDRARLHDDSEVPEEGFDRPYRIRNMAMLAMLGWNPRLYSPNLKHRLHRVDVPTLIIWGKEDRLYPPVYGETYAALIPSAKLEVVPEAGHLPYEDQPEEVAGFIERFIDGGADDARRGGGS